MTVYYYISVDKNGRKKKGIIEGDSSSQVCEKLLNQNLTMLELSETHDRRKLFYRSDTYHAKSNTLLLITYQLNALLSAGIPISLALQNTAEQVDNPRLKTVLLTLRTRLLEGHSLASAMSEFPSVFPQLYQATIESGEKSGHLAEILDKLVKFLEQQEHIKQKITQALIYPALLLSVSIIIIVYLLIYTMPTITQTFADNGQKLPTATLVLLGIAHGLKSYGIYFLGSLIIIFVGIKHWLKSDVFRYRMQSIALKVPYVNKAIVIINAAQFLRTFGILFAAGTPITQAMQIANQVVGFLPIQAAIKLAIEEIAKGTHVHEALFNTGYFTKTCTQLVASGESSGTLSIMLEKTADFQEQQVLRWIGTALSLFEPAIILIMGMVVIFIVLATLLPVFQMNDLIVQ